YDHPVARHYAGLIRYLPREHLRVVLFRVNGPDDALARDLQASADSVVTLSPQQELPALQRQIAAEQLDVLIFTDIGMDLATYFLAFAQLAPVQCVLAGHPVTTGIPTIDYYLSGRDGEPADAREHYSETLVLLANPPHYFERPQLEGPPRSRADFGLPQD